MSIRTVCGRFGSWSCGGWLKPAKRSSLLVLIALASACGSDPTPIAPSPANVAGNWTGTLASNYSPQAVAFILSQSGSNVSGTWGAPNADWTGTITGTTDVSSFTGTFTLSAPNSTGIGVRCTGTASVNGPVVSGNTVTWVSPGFTGSCTGEPTGLTFKMQR